jgi:phosphatidylglycerophosphate synthase
MTEPSTRTGDRRPIAAREWAVSKRLAERLARRGVSPSAISAAGMICGVGAGVALWTTSVVGGYAWFFWLLAAALIQLRLTANMLDGMVAVASGRTSPIGELFNEAPDRVSDAATLIGAGYAAGGQVELGYAAACVALFTAYVRALGKVAGAPQEFCGPMAKQQRMFVMTVVALYCGLAPTNWQPDWGLPAAALVVIILGGLVTAVRRLSRTAAYLRKQNQ